MGESRRYYAEETEQRRRYFDSQFLSLAKTLASESGVTLSQYLSGLKDFESFKPYLETVFNADASLANYFSGMDNNEIQTFFDRARIQEIVDKNTEGGDIDQRTIPDYVVQVNKKNKEYFDASIKGRKTRAYKDSFQRRGKKIDVLRTPNGRFAKKS